MESLPKLVPCPVCGEKIAEDADRCIHCRTAVKAHFDRIKAEEDARLAQLEAEREQAERERSRARWIMGIVGVALLLWIASCISDANAHKQYFYNSAGISETPGAYSFQAAGKVQLKYSCTLNSGKTATVEISLVDLKTSKAVWSKQVKCVTGNSDGVIPEYTDMVQLKSSNYDVDIKMSGDATWSMKITQA